MVNSFNLCDNSMKQVCYFLHVAEMETLSHRDEIPYAGLCGWGKLDFFNHGYLVHTPVSSSLMAHSHIKEKGQCGQGFHLDHLSRDVRWPSPGPWLWLDGLHSGGMFFLPEHPTGRRTLPLVRWEDPKAFCVCHCSCWVDKMVESLRNSSLFLQLYWSIIDNWIYI